MIDVWPVFLTGLDRRRSVVVGGGVEAEKKVRSLLAARARVTLVARRVTPGLRRLGDERAVEWVRRDFRSGDLSGAFLVVAAEVDEATAARVFAEAESSGALVNVVDDVARSSFIAGSIVRRGALTVAISTGGTAPAFAVRLRQRLEAELGPEHAALLALADRLREPLARHLPDFEHRRRVWYELVDSGLTRLLRAGDLPRARRLLGALARRNGLPASAVVDALDAVA